MSAADAARRRALDGLVDREALAEFRRAHGTPRFARVAIVVAAYREAATIGGVVAGMPSRLCGEPTTVLVVVDGDDDGSAAIVRDVGGFACVAPVNRGQGAALRLGYRVARDHGAQVIVTADADGQTDPRDLEAVVAPILAGEADFVNGSRRLGRTESHDLVRNLGVVVFAGLLTRLTGVPVTDSANPVRAFRTSLLDEIELEEPQYQASELLIGAIAAGCRFTERPVTMLARAAGRSRKGRNLAYGYRYGRVLLRTWWRERRVGRLPR